MPGTIVVGGTGDMDYVGILVAANLALGFEGFVVTGSQRGRKIATRVAVVGGNAQLPPRFNAVDIGDPGVFGLYGFNGNLVFVGNSGEGITRLNCVLKHSLPPIRVPWP